MTTTRTAHAARHGEPTGSRTGGPGGRRPSGGLVTAAAAGLLALGAGLSTYYADAVITWAPGTAAHANGNNALGPPSGGGLFLGSTHAASLGVQGWTVLQLDEAAFDGAGTDLIVCENAFFVSGAPGTAFVEAVFVEVSTDGNTFVRFPAEYGGPAVQSPPFAGVRPEWYFGFAGVLPVSADPAKGVDPLHLVHGGGDAFDLGDLADDPAVVAGDVDLYDIRYVRLVDVRSGVDTDDLGTEVFDAGLDASASADIDALVVVNSLPNQVPQRPAVELELDSSGFLHLVIEDLNGIDTVVAGLTASANGSEFDFYALLPLFLITELTDTRATLVTGPVPPGEFGVIFKVAAQDPAGHVGGDAVHIR